MDLSIIIPVLNERHKIAADIHAAIGFFKEYNFTGELIIVDDGSTDGTADEVCRIAKTYPQVPVLLERYAKQMGKGHALRKGFARSTGKFVMFSDSGSTIPFENTLPALEKVQNSTCQLAHGSRQLPESKIIIPQKWQRRITSTLFKWAMRFSLAIPKLTDTQCGFKIYQGDIARSLYSQAQCDGFMIDIELVLLATRAGYHIEEFPVQWRCDPDSRLSLVKNWRQILKEWLFLIRQ